MELPTLVFPDCFRLHPNDEALMCVRNVLEDEFEAPSGRLPFGEALSGEASSDDEVEIEDREEGEPVIPTCEVCGIGTRITFDNSSVSKEETWCRQCGVRYYHLCCDATISTDLPCDDFRYVEYQDTCNFIAHDYFCNCSHWGEPPRHPVQLLLKMSNCERSTRREWCFFDRYVDGDLAARLLPQLVYQGE